MNPPLTSIAAALVLLVSLATPAFAADPDSPVARCDGKFGLCRYVDRKSGAELIPARFERAMPFSEGVAAVRIDGRFGYIDRRGELVISPRFDLAGEFYQGLAEILVDANTGIVSRTGQVIVPPQFRRAVPLTKDVIIAVEGAWRSGYYEGFEKLPNLKEGAQLEMAGLYHVSGRWLRRPDLRRVSLFESEGRGLVWAYVRGESPIRLGCSRATAAGWSSRNTNTPAC